MNALLIVLYVAISGTSLTLVAKRHMRAWRLYRATRRDEK